MAKKEKIFECKMRRNENEWHYGGGGRIGMNSRETECVLRMSFFLSLIWIIASICSGILVPFPRAFFPEVQRFFPIIERRSTVRFAVYPWQYNRFRLLRVPRGFTRSSLEACLVRNVTASIANNNINDESNVVLSNTCNQTSKDEFIWRVKTILAWTRKYWRYTFFFL